MDELRFRREFRENGFFILNCFLDKRESSEICKNISAQVSGKHLIPHPYFNRMIFDHRFTRLCEILLGEKYLFHHANGQMLPGNNEGKAWHHDYDGKVPWHPGLPIMMHILMYPYGLNEDIGSLSVLPKSHLLTVTREQPNRFGFQRLEGQVNVVGEPGLVVILNSALWHARQPNKTNNQRCYLNYSYFQPGTERPEREEWRERLTITRRQVDEYEDKFNTEILSLDT